MAEGRDRVNWRHRALVDRAEWMDKGKCAGSNGRWHVAPTWGEETREQREKRERQAKVVCSECDVVEVCLQYAIDNGEMDVWGKTTRSERVRIIRARRAQGA